MCIEYEHFFGESGRLHPLLSFLNLDMTQDIAAGYRTMVAQNVTLAETRGDGLSAIAKQHVLLHADVEAYRQVLGVCTR